MLGKSSLVMSLDVKALSYFLRAIGLFSVRNRTMAIRCVAFDLLTILQKESGSSSFFEYLYTK